MTKIIGGVLIFGIYLVFIKEISYLIKDISSSTKGILKYAGKGKLSKHISRIFKVISQEGKEKRDQWIFYIVTISAFIISFITLYQVFKWKGIFMAVTLTVLPYSYIRMKLILKQRAGSFEGEVFLKEVYTQYKICDGNIVTCIDETVKKLTENEAITRRALFRVSTRIKTAKTDLEINEILKDFVYALNTDWSKQLTNNFYSAIAEKVDISKGLEDLLLTCKKINTYIEQNKRGNMEAMGMIKFIRPVFIFIFTYLLSETMEIKKWQLINFVQIQDLFCFASSLLP